MDHPGPARRECLSAESRASAGGDWENGYLIEATPTAFSISFEAWSDEAPDFQRTVTHSWTKQGDRFVQVGGGE